MRPKLLCKWYYAHRMDRLADATVEEVDRRSSRPVSIVLCEVPAHKMTRDAGHSHRAIAPWPSKREGELIVLHILIAAYVSL